jgi:hypothetical protein
LPAASRRQPAEENSKIHTAQGPKTFIADFQNRAIIGNTRLTMSKAVPKSTPRAEESVRLLQWRTARVRVGVERQAEWEPSSKIQIDSLTRLHTRPTACRKQRAAQAGTKRERAPGGSAAQQMRSGQASERRLRRSSLLRHYAPGMPRLFARSQRMPAGRKARRRKHGGPPAPTGFSLTSNHCYQHTLDNFVSPKDVQPELRSRDLLRESGPSGLDI